MPFCWAPSSHCCPFIRRCIRTGFCSPDLADFHDLYISSDEKLFNKISTCPNHILQTLLPPPTAQNYSLRNRPNNRQLPDHISQITDCNFTVRMLYRNMYWLLYILDMCFVLFLCTTAVWQFAINEYVMLCYLYLLPNRPTLTNRPHTAAAVDTWERQMDGVALYRPCHILCEQCQ